MSKLICGALIAVTSMAAQAAMPQMTEIDWDVLHTLSRISPATHYAVLYVANECRLVPNSELVSALLATPLIAEVKAAMPSGRTPEVPAPFCAKLGSAAVAGF